jgi:hypothetical protein
VHRKASSRLLRILAIKGFFFKNAQYVFKHFDELKKNIDLFDDAKVMWFYAGELFPEFYNSESFLHTMEKSIGGKRGKMSVVFGPALYVENKEFLALALSTDKVELYKRSRRDPIHFKIVRRPDDKILAILDKEHPIDIDKDDRYSVLMGKGYESEINFLARKFESTKLESIRVTMENLFDEFPKGIHENGEWRGFISRREADAVSANEDQIDGLRAYLEKRVPRKKFNHEGLIP